MPVTSRRSRRFFLVAGLSCALAADAPDGSGQEAGASARATTLVANPGPRGGEWKRVFNPFRSEADTRWPTAAGIHEPLIVYNRATRRLHAVAGPGYPWSADNRSFRVPLRPGVRWSDGPPSPRATWPSPRADAPGPRPRSRRECGSSWRRREPRRRPDRRVQVQAGLHARARATWATRPSSPSTSGRTSRSRRPSTTRARGHRTRHGSAAVRAHGVRDRPQSQILAGRQAGGWTWCACRCIEATRTSCGRSGSERWTGPRSSSPTSRGSWVATNPARHQYWYPDPGPRCSCNLNTRRQAVRRPRGAQGDQHGRRSAADLAQAMNGYAPPGGRDRPGGIAEDGRTAALAEAPTGRSRTSPRRTAARRRRPGSGSGRDRVGSRGGRHAVHLKTVQGWTDWGTGGGIMRQNLAEVGVDVTVKRGGIQCVGTTASTAGGSR